MEFEIFRWERLSGLLFIMFRSEAVFDVNMVDLFHVSRHDSAPSRLMPNVALDRSAYLAATK